MTGCQQIGCDQPAVALIAAPIGMPGAPVFAIVRPLTSPVQIGDQVCLDHAHHAVDLMLMRAKEGTP